MKKSFNQFIKDALNLRLSAEEKGDIRKKLEAFVALKPVRNFGDVRHNLERSKNENYFTSLFNPLLKIMPLVLIAALLIGGGVSLAAENSLPGDSLYTVKTEVNERAWAWTQLSDEASVRLDGRLAGRRLKEAERMALNGSLNAKTGTEIESRFEAHTRQVNIGLVSLSASSNSDVAADVGSFVEASLRAHDRALAGISESRVELRAPIAGIRAMIQNQILEVSQRRLDAEVSFSSKTEAEIKVAAEGKLVAAENKIAEVEKFIKISKSRLGTEVVTEIEAELLLAREAFLEGKAKVKAELYAEAFRTFQRSLRIAQEAQLLVGLKLELNTGKVVEIAPRGELRQNNSNTEFREETDRANDESVSGSGIEGEIKAGTDVSTESGNTKADGEVKIEIDLNL